MDMAELLFDALSCISDLRLSARPKAKCTFELGVFLFIPGRRGGTFPSVLDSLAFLRSSPLVAREPTIGVELKGVKRSAFLVRQGSRPDLQTLTQLASPPSPRWWRASPPVGDGQKPRNRFPDLTF